MRLSRIVRRELEVRKGSSMHHRIEEMIFFLGLTVKRAETRRTVIYSGGDLDRIKHILKEAGEE